MISGVSNSSSYYEQIAKIQAQGQQARTNPFEENDANTDGFLDIEELGAMAEKMSEITGNEVDAQEMLESLDTDGDGQVSEAEFESGKPKGPPPGGPPPEMMSSGSIGELMMAMLSGSEESSEEEEAYFDSLDANEDGVVDADELKAGMSKLIQAYQQQDGSAFGLDSGAQGGLSLQV